MVAGKGHESGQEVAGVVTPFDDRVVLRQALAGAGPVISVLVAAMTALVITLLGTPAVVRLFRGRGYGQEIREDGPASHATKRGTPTMGGTVIILATLVGYGVAHLVALRNPGRGPTASGLLLLGLMVSLGLVGFLDDFIKIRKQRSLGLTAIAKFGGQLITGVGFAVLRAAVPHQLEHRADPGLGQPVVRPRLRRSSSAPSASSSSPT